MSAITVVLLFIVIFAALACFLRVPVAFAMGGTALIMFAVIGLKPAHYAQGLYTTLDSFSYLAIPFFVLAGGLMQYSGISESLVRLIDAIAGRLKASLGAVTILASLAFGVLTGSNMATMATIGGIMIPEMDKKGYKNSYCGALVAACSYLGTLIPPSVPGIMFALSSGCKVSEVWLSTVIPGIMFAAGYLVYNRYSQRNTEKKDDVAFSLARYSANVCRQFGRSFGALLMPIIIFGGIYGGIFTATEAGAVSVAYGLIYYVLKLIRKKKNGGKMEAGLFPIFRDSMATTAMICCLLCFARSAGYVFTLSGVADALSVFIVNNFNNKYTFLLALNIIFLIQGTFIDLNSGILIMTPLLLPSVQAMGIDPIHFGAIMLCNLNIGSITPPLAGSLYFGAKLAKADVVETIKEAVPFMLIGIICTLIVTYLPITALALI